MGRLQDIFGVQAVPAGDVSLPEAPPPAAPLLGSVLVEHGLLTEEQLAVALEEQGHTGEPLGKVIIALGFVDAPMVAQGLASQHGGLLKTEYGWATGFGFVPGFRADGRTALDTEPPLSPAPVGAESVPPPPRPALEPAHLEPLAVAPAAVVDITQELASAREELDELRLRTRQLEDEIERLHAEVAEESAAGPLRERLLRERLADLERRVDAALPDLPVKPEPPV